MKDKSQRDLIADVTHRMLRDVQWSEVENGAVIADPVSDDEPPHVTHVGTLRLLQGQTLRCFQLSNGQRIFDLEDVKRLFAGAKVEF